MLICRFSSNGVCNFVVGKGGKPFVLAEEAHKFDECGHVERAANCWYDDHNRIAVNFVKEQSDMQSVTSRKPLTSLRGVPQVKFLRLPENSTSGQSHRHQLMKMEYLQRLPGHRFYSIMSTRAVLSSVV